MNFKRNPIKPMTKVEAQKEGIYYKVKNPNNIAGMSVSFGYIFPRTTEFVYVETLTGQEAIIGLETMLTATYNHMECCGVYDPKTGLPMHSDVHIDDIVRSIVRPYDHVLSRSGKTVSVFLDQVNMDYYKNKAEEYLDNFGNHQLPKLTITGKAYHDKIIQMCQIAEEVITGKRLPDLFDHIRTKKDGSFQANRKFTIFDNNLVCWEENLKLYGACNKLTLCIVTQDTFEFYDHYDVIEHIDPYRARLAITVTPNSKKQIPLVTL